MLFVMIVLGIGLGLLVGASAPTISYTYSTYLAIGIIASLDSVFGGISASIKKNFDLPTFVSGFFGNAILSMALIYLGHRLNLDIYIAVVVVFVNRMFINLAIIRKHYVGLLGHNKEKSTTVQNAEIIGLPSEDKELYWWNITKILQNYNKLYWLFHKNVIF